MSLTESSPPSERPGASEVAETTAKARTPAPDSPSSDLARDAVPLRDHAPDDLECEREERITRVLASGRRSLPRRPSRAALLYASGVFAVISLLTAVAMGGGRQTAHVAKAAHATEASPGAPQHQRLPPTHRLARAGARRQAATAAKQRAARRRAMTPRTGSTHDRHHSREPMPPQTELAPETSASAAPTPEAEPEPTSAPAPPQPSTAPETSNDPAQGQFGFEH